MGSALAMLLKPIKATVTNIALIMLIAVAPVVREAHKF
jgi:hypothetical protein